MTKFIPSAKPLISDEERAAVDRAMPSGMIAQGPGVAEFEREFGEHFGLGRACVAVNSGASGLHLGFLRAGVGAGAEVIGRSFTFAATAISVALTGTTPEFASIDPDSFCLDPISVEAAITDKTVGIMPVHLYGHPANMLALQSIARTNGRHIFEDAAQVHVASLDGTPVGGFGTFAVSSLYPTKNMASGEGGIVSVGSDEIERLLRLHPNQGMQCQCEDEVVGFNNRMTDLQAAIGRVLPTKGDGSTNQRRDNAASLSDNLVGVTLRVADGAVHVYHLYTIGVTDDRDGLAEALKDDHNLGSGMSQPIPNHRLTPLQSAVDPPATDLVAKQCLSMPVHLSPWSFDLERMVSAVDTLAAAGG